MSYQGGGGYGGAYGKSVQTPAYICGACSSKVEIRPKEPIRCKECGHRIVYKPRTTKMLHFEAR